MSIRPTLPVLRTEWANADAVGRIRLSLLSNRPEASAEAARSALQLFSYFLLTVKNASWASLNSRTVADFLIWRVLEHDTLPPPPAPRQRVVRIASALATLTHLRMLAPRLRLCESAVLFGDEIREVQKALRTENTPDAVRKTPFPVDTAMDCLKEARRNPECPKACFAAAFCLLGLFFFLRVGEVSALEWRDIRLEEHRVSVSFRYQKNSGGQRNEALSRIVTRTCTLPEVVEACRLWRSATVKRTGPAFPMTTSCQEYMRSLAGWPPILPGEERPLPWSLRAGGASLLFGRLDTDVIMKLGRWRSSVGVMYCVMTPLVQQRLWDSSAAAVDLASAFGDAEDINSLLSDGFVRADVRKRTRPSSLSAAPACATASASARRRGSWRP